MLIQGVLAYLLLLSAFKFTIDSESYFMFLAIFLTLLYIFVSIVIPITLLIRINKVVKKIQINEYSILFTSNKEFVFSKNDLNFREVKNRFTGFSTRNKSGILLKTKGGKELWIIEDFFNEFEELRQSLITFCL